MPQPAVTPLFVDASAESTDSPFDGVVRGSLRARRVELLSIDAELDLVVQRLGDHPAARRLAQAQANARVARQLVDRALIEAHHG